MNRNIFKVIFNKRTGKLAVVSEITQSEGKSARETTQDQGRSWGYHSKIHPISFAVLLAIGTITTSPATAQARRVRLVVASKFTRGQDGKNNLHSSF